jgi:hypothetical protein
MAKVFEGGEARHLDCSIYIIRMLGKFVAFSYQLTSLNLP